MNRAAALLVLLAIVCLVFALSREDSPDPVYVEASAKTAQTSSTTVLSDAAVPSLGDGFGALVEAMKPKPRPKARTAPKPRTAPRQVYVAAGTAHGHACGGDLPPCYVMLRESGGDPRAVNPTGCGGRGCYGKWQYDPRTWRNYGGYAFASDAPESVQDDKARLDWAGGRGCHHWNACA